MLELIFEDKSCIWMLRLDVVVECCGWMLWLNVVVECCG